MTIKSMVVFFCCMVLVNIPANAAPIGKLKQQQQQLLLIDNEIYQIAKKNGLSKFDISIYWKQTISGDYKAIVKCHNTKKCKTSVVVISFPKANNQEASFIAPTSFQDKIKDALKPLTGNPGPGFSPSPNNN
jgi:hypothetical protein